MRRATSTAYYALFHCLARACADLMVGGDGAKKSPEAWSQVYRALSHGTAKDQCKNQKVMNKFPQEIQDFANQFVAMQTNRHEADYNPTGSYFKSAVMAHIATTERAIKDFGKATVKDRRAFAAWVLFKVR